MLLQATHVCRNAHIGAAVAARSIETEAPRAGPGPAPRGRAGPPSPGRRLVFCRLQLKGVVFLIFVRRFLSILRKIT